jgi:hypothetical protein
LHGLLELFDTSEDCVYLERETPSFGLFVVLFKHVDIFSTEVLPIFDWLFDPFGFRNVLSEDFKEGRFSASDISFDSEAELAGVGLRIDKVFSVYLSVISR